MVKINIDVEEKNFLRLKEKSKFLDFSSLEKYIEFILEQTLEEDSSEEDMNEDEEKEVKEKLKDLGYI